MQDRYSRKMSFKAKRKARATFEPNTKHYGKTYAKTKQIKAISEQEGY